MAEMIQLRKSLETKIESSKNNFEALKSYGQRWFPLIYRIPAEIREVNERAYTPSVVSIGPLHREADHLQAMEEHKLSYMRCLFLRFRDKEEATQQLCMEAMLEMESTARKYYAEFNIEAENEVATKVKFAEMLLIDGCFIIELLFRNYQRIAGNLVIHDPILDNYSMRSAIQHDFILLENQIPFEVIVELFSKTLGTLPNLPIILFPTIPDHNEQFKLQNFIFYFFKDIMISVARPNYEHAMPFHMLDYLHACYLFSGRYSSEETQQPVFKYSATQLDLAGVEFMPENSESGLMLINFQAPECFTMFRSARFEIPPLHITYSTETFLRNLIAVEQIGPADTRHLISHAFLMDKLINNAKDVDLLVEAGVIHNYLGSSEEVAHLYNNMCKNVNVSGFYFTEPCEQATDYCKRWWPRFLVKLKRDYFGNPWAFISVLAAFSLFVLTLLQTIWALK